MSAPRKQSKRRTSDQVMPERHLRWWCEECRKHSYVERHHAKDERRRLRTESQRRGDARPLDIYRCPTGSGHWHIGHNLVRHEEQRRYYLGHGVGMEDR